MKATDSPTATFDLWPPTLAPLIPGAIRRRLGLLTAANVRSSDLSSVSFFKHAAPASHIIARL